MASAAAFIWHNNAFLESIKHIDIIINIDILCFECRFKGLTHYSQFYRSDPEPTRPGVLEQRAEARIEE
jgi:hypothetical protein